MTLDFDPHPNRYGSAVQCCRYEGPAAHSVDDDVIEGWHRLSHYGIPHASIVAHRHVQLNGPRRFRGAQVGTRPLNEFREDEFGRSVDRGFYFDEASWDGSDVMAQRAPIATHVFTRIYQQSTTGRSQARVTVNFTRHGRSHSCPRSRSLDRSIPRGRHGYESAPTTRSGRAPRLARCIAPA